MKRVMYPIVALILIGLGALGSRLFFAPAAPQPAAQAPAPSGGTNTVVSLPASSSNLSASAIDAAIQRAYAIASPSVVYVLNVGTGSGSGVIYDAKGDIVTNDHVVSGATKLTVTLNNGKTYPASLVGTDVRDDLAVIHINAPNLVPAHFAGNGGYSVAQMVLAIGSPLGLQQSVTSGLISGLNRVEQEPNGSYIPNAVQTSAPINPGNSGGALVTLNGVVVGMPTLEQTSTSNGESAQAIGFAIPSQRIVSIASQIVSTGKVEHTGRAYLGIDPTDSTGAAGGTFGQGGGFFGQGSGNTPTVAGALVQQVAANGPAGRAGVQQGDVITRFNGTTISSANDLLTALAQEKPGKTVTLTVNRNGSTVTVKVVLGEMPAS